MIIKESEIRQYIRSLIKESIEAESQVKPEEINRWLSMTPEELMAYQPTKKEARVPEDYKNRIKMLLGQGYSMRKFGDKSLEIQQAYREKMGYTPLSQMRRRGYKITDINADGTDGTYDNSEEGRAKIKAQAAQQNRDKTNNFTISKADRQTFADAHGIDVKDVTTDPYANKPDQDPHFQKEWGNLTPEERMEKADRIRRERVMAAHKAREAEIASGFKGLKDNRTHVSTPEEMEERVKMLSDKLATLGPRTDLNAREYDDYVRLIDNANKIKRSLEFQRRKAQREREEDDDLAIPLKSATSSLDRDEQTFNPLNLDSYDELDDMTLDDI